MKTKNLNRKTESIKTSASKIGEQHCKQSPIVKWFLAFTLLLSISGINNLFAFAVDEPSGTTLKRCTTVRFHWEKWNNNTDRYDWTVTFSGFDDQDGDGFQDPTELKIAKTLGEGQNEEDHWYAGQERNSSEISIGKNWVGTVLVTVIARRRALNWLLQAQWVAQGSTAKEYSVGLEIIASPSPILKFFCGAENYTLISQPTNSAYHINWYQEFTSSTPMFTGTNFNYNFNEGLTTFYISQAEGESGCGAESLKMPVAVYVFPGKSPAPIETSWALKPEPDPRMNEPNCSRVGTYHDLDPDITGLVPIPLPDDVDLPDGLGSISATASALTWRDKTYFGQPGEKYRVCNSNLPQGNGTYRTYYADAVVNASISLIHPYDNTPLISGNFSCTVKELMISTVYKSRACEPDWPDAFQIYETNPSSSGPCLREQFTIICPNSTAIIGPSDVDYPPAGVGLGYKFSWNTSEGLSDRTARNPTITYSTLPVNPGQYLKYSCMVSKTIVNDDNEAIPGEKYCSYIYKCPDCGTSGFRMDPLAPEDSLAEADNVFFEDEPVEINEKLSLPGTKINTPVSTLNLYPNPASDILNIEYQLAENEAGVLTINDLLGRSIQTVQLQANTSQKQIALTDLSKGTYLCSLHSDNGHLVSKVLLVIK